MNEKKQVLCQPQAIFLMGPTAAGKTALAMALHQHLPVDIISVDSALMYRNMNIGTAKPSAAELARVPHRLLDILDPAESYSAAEFRIDAIQAMNEVTECGRIPLLVGGTMLYFKILLEGLAPLPPANPEVRANIKLEAKTLGWQALHCKLQKIDPIAANRIHPNDQQRLSRALEIFLVSGNTLTELTKISGEALMYRVHQFAIAPLNRTLLHHRLAQRFHQMLANGFEKEVYALFSRADLHRDLPSIRCVGYRQIWSYLAGETSYDDMVFRGICATKQLAKRQMNWLRGWKNIHWLNSDEPVASLNRVLKAVIV